MKMKISAKFYSKSQYLAQFLVVSKADFTKLINNLGVIALSKIRGTLVLAVCLFLLLNLPKFRK